MPRDMRVLKCNKCQFMTADFVKKSNIWICKICGEVQSFITEYERGSAVHCRLFAQKFNNQKVEMNWFSVDLSLMFADECELDNFEINNSKKNLSQDENENRVNKWSKYIESDEEKCESENDTLTQSNKRLEDIINFPKPSKIRRLSKYPEATITSNQMNELQSSKYQGDGKIISKMIPEATITSNQMNELNLLEDYKEIVVYQLAEPRTPESGERNNNKSRKNSKWAVYLIDENEEEEKKE